MPVLAWVAADATVSIRRLSVPGGADDGYDVGAGRRGPGGGRGLWLDRHRPAFGDEQVRVCDGELKGLADDMAGQVHTIEAFRQLPSQAHTDRFHDTSGACNKGVNTLWRLVGSPGPQASKPHSVRRCDDSI